MNITNWLVACTLVLSVAPAGAFEVCLDGGAPIVAGTGQIAFNSTAIKASGAKWARVNFILGPWTSPTDATRRGPANLTWKETYDNIINSLVSNGVNVYALVGAEAVKSNASNINSDQYVNDLAANFQTIVGQFKDRVRVYESFNEPNDWAGGTSAQLQPFWFAKLLAKIYKTVKVDAGHSGDPSWQVTLVSGPLFSHDQDTCATYLQQTYQAGIQQLDWTAIKNQTGTYPLDGIGYHIYVAQGSNSETAVTAALNTNLTAIWNKIKLYEGSGTSKKLWISEFSWNSASVSESEQARNLTLAYNLFDQNSHIDFASWFQINDFGSTSKYGLFRGGISDALKKPSWFAFHDFAIANQSNDATLSGTVTQSGGGALSGVTVSTDPAGYSGITGADGKYTFSSVVPGQYNVRATKFGWRPTTHSVTVAAGQTAVSDFALDPAQSVASISAARGNASGAYLKIAGNFIVTAVFPGDRLYVQAPLWSGGIAAVGATAEVGDKVSVTGESTTVDGERVLSNAAVDVVLKNQSVPGVLGATTRAVGGGAVGLQNAVVDDASINPAVMASDLGLTGLLTKVTGNTTFSDALTGIFYIDDGEGMKDGTGHTGLRAIVSGSPPPALGQVVEVTGIAGITQIAGRAARLLRVRSGADVIGHYPSAPQYQVSVSQGEQGNLEASYSASDLLQGRIPDVLPGDLGWHPANSDPADQLPAFTDGVGVRATGLTGLLNDFPAVGQPAKLIDYDLGTARTINEIRVFSGNAGLDGRVFQTYTVEMSKDGSAYGAPIYVQSHASGTRNTTWRMCLTRLSAAGGPLDVGVRRIRFKFYAVSNTEGLMWDPFIGINPFTAADDGINTAAFESPLIWEIDVLGQ